MCMKTLLVSLPLIAGLSLISVGCCADGKAKSKPKPVFDRELGHLETEIIRKNGRPKEVLIKKAKEMVGELRSALKSKVPDENTEVKELYYKTDTGERIFWLTKQPKGEWKVISDVEIPPGVVF